MIPVGTQVRLTVPLAGMPVGTKGVVADMPGGAAGKRWDLAVRFGPIGYPLCMDAHEVEVAS